MLGRRRDRVPALPSSADGCPLILASLVFLASTNNEVPWACEGPFVPPSGYEQETAFSKDGAGAAADAARAKLSQRICQSTPCADLAARVAVWQAGHGAPGFCAMAVVEHGLVDEWRASLSARSLHKELASALRPLLVAPSPGKRRVAIGDVQAPGGGLAVSTWLRAQLVEAVSSVEGVEVVDAGAPRVDTTLRANAVERVESQRALLDISVELKGKDGALKSTTVSAARAAVPWTPPIATPTEKALELKVEASCQKKRGAAYLDIACGDEPLTHGDRYRLRLTVSEPSFGYVIAYNSLGQFQVLYPFPDEDNALRPSAPLVFPPEDWLELDEHGGVSEHVIVVASRERQAQLELLRGVDIPPKGTGAVDERPATTRSYLGAVTSRGFNRNKKPATNSGASALEHVQQGPGLAAVELTLAHR